MPDIPTNVKPIGPHVLIQKDDTEKKTAGGLIIPETAQNPLKTQFGTVLAASEGERMPDGALRPLQVKAGDRVLIEKYMGVQVNIDGVECILVQEDRIFGVIEEE